MMDCYLDSLYLNAKKEEDGSYVITLSNGSVITVVEHPEHNGSVWAWKVDSQVFDRTDRALNYLKALVGERLTGKRIIYHTKREAPDICGADGCGCRHPGKCNTGLCSQCPVAEAFMAERDGVELIYAVGPEAG